MTPTTTQQLAEALRAGACRGEPTALYGASTKQHMGRVADSPATRISTVSLNRVIQYEPKDLTISVEAGMRYAELKLLLAQNRQMLPLDPPYAGHATIGGIIAANTCGPRRRWYGAPRDMVIGMTFIPLEGQIVRTGGMVVKNVAGLDMGKLLIGSMGTLAAIATINFKLVPLPEGTRTFRFGEPSVEALFSRRDWVLKSVLQPAAIDVLNPPAAEAVGLSGWSLLLRAGGSQRVLDRYSRELAGADVLEGDAEARLWHGIEELTPNFLQAFPATRVIRVSSSLQQVRAVTESFAGPVVSRAGTGVSYGYLREKETWRPAPGWKACYEYGGNGESWSAPGDDFAVMQQVKRLLDPRGLLNPGGYYGRF